MYYIYGLVNPLLPENHPEYVFYVGQTSNLKIRLGQHLANESNEAKCLIIDSIFRETGGSPQMLVLERTSEDEVRDREDWWEAHFRFINPNLTNAERLPKAYREPPAKSTPGDPFEKALYERVINHLSEFPSYAVMVKNLSLEVSPSKVQRLMNQCGYKDYEVLDI